MNTTLNQFIEFFKALSGAELLLSLLMLLFLVLFLYYFTRVMNLEEKMDALQKDYAQRRKRVYQDFLQAWNETKTPKSEDEEPASPSAVFSPVLSEIGLWGSDKVVKKAIKLKTMLGGSPSEAEVSRIVAELIQEMRIDLGFANKGLRKNMIENLIT
jgi:hypothetical protein